MGASRRFENTDYPGIGNGVHPGKPVPAAAKGGIGQVLRPHRSAALCEFRIEIDTGKTAQAHFIKHPQSGKVK
jgi:hypothetical protein